MANFEAWIADCHLKEFEGDGEYKCQAGVWADCYDAFRDTLIAYLKERGLGIVWLEEVLPAGQYLARHGAQQQKIEGLAQSVHSGHLVELGRMSAIGGDGEPLRESYLTITEHEFKPLPDQSDLPFWDQEWIAPELKELLFGQPKEGPPLRTYFIVDATLRKNITGIFDLDTVDVPVQCLFKGDAADEMKEVAPYLIDMTLPEGALDDRDKVPAFHKDFFARHWGENTGIFIRTPALMSEVWGHFRKFTRIQMEEDGRWVYFRFADPRTISAFVEALDEDDTHKFLGAHHLINPGKNDLKTYYATSPIGENQRRSLPPLIMKSAYVAAFGMDRRSKVKSKILTYLEEHSRVFRDTPNDEKSNILDKLMKQAVSHGIKIERAVADFALASILFRRTLSDDPQFERIIKSNKNQIDKGRLLLREVRFRQSPTKR